MDFSLTKKRFVLWLAISMLLIWHGIQAERIRNSGRIPLYDFAEYWAACRVFLSGGNPYDPAMLLKEQRLIGWMEKDPIMMWNPPWAIPILIPLSFLGYWPSRGLWLLVSCILLWVACDWFWRLCGGSASRRWLSWLAPAFFLPAALTLFLGQITVLVLSGMAGFLWALKKKRMFLAGIFTILISIKPHLLFLFWVFLVLWILKERYWKVLAGALLSLACASILVISVNPRIFLDYMTSMLSKSGPQIWSTPTWGVAFLMVFPNASTWIRYLPSAIGMLVSIYLWYSWKCIMDWQQRLPIILLLSVTTCAFTWTFDWVVLLPVVILFLCWFEKQPSRYWWLVAGVLAMQPLLVISQATTHTNFYSIWLPPALWFLYWIGSRMKSELCHKARMGI